MKRISPRKIKNIFVVFCIFRFSGLLTIDWWSVLKLDVVNVELAVGNRLTV